MSTKTPFNPNGPSFSFEFFPPKDEEAELGLRQTLDQLTQLSPSHVTVTYGAGGSTRRLTRELVTYLQERLQIPVVAHLTCVGNTKSDFQAILENYVQQGINHVLALRGDPPGKQEQFQPVKGGFSNATELVHFIRKNFPHMTIGVAGFTEGHPETPNRIRELEYLKAKIDAGADYICTQMFFDNHFFYDYCERCEQLGINVPIIAGIMPLASRSAVDRIADLAAGTCFPAKLLSFLSNAHDKEHAHHVGTHWAAQQILDLLHHDVAGIHLYTLNKSLACTKICQTLGAADFAELSSHFATTT